MDSSQEQIPFLKRAAQYIFEQSQSKALPLKRLCVVVPTRRAVFFFKHELAQLSEIPILSPEILAIDDFVMQLSGLRPMDSVGLLFELYDTFKEIDPTAQFDRFAAWGGILLQDFDRIDQYLVKAREVFSWVAAAKELERWQPDQHWQHDRKDQDPGPTAEKYFQLFNNLTEVYERFQQRLRDRGFAYRGMAYQHVASQRFETFLKPEPNPYEFYYFVGFNALSKAEEEIVTYLIDKKRAETLWDSDTYYMERNHNMEAGKLLRKYKVNPQYGPENHWQWQTDDLVTGKKNIQIIGVTNASMQSKVAGAIYRNWNSEQNKKEKSNGSAVPAAIVLGDENLLMPMLYSLDESVEAFNVTMGLSLRNSMLYTLVDAVFEMQRNLVEFRNKEGETLKIPKFSHRHVLKILNHPFIRRYELIYFESKSKTNKATTTESPNPQPSNPVREAIRRIKKESRVFLSDKEIKELGQNHELFEVLFTRWDNDPQKAIQYFYSLIDLLRGVYRENKDAIETEYLYLFYTLLKRLEAIMSERKEAVSLRSFRSFLYDLIRQTKIPFSGEPIAPLQIMGMLETRTLDFERVIVLSVNEGVLPQGKKQNSLIPFDAAVEFGLPTHGEQDAVMSYHFFRLLQRAKEIVLVYSQASGDTGGSNEPSRFLLQIEHELAKINPNITLEKPSVHFQTLSEDTEPSAELEIQKNDEVLAFLRKQLAEKGLYPSHLNQFIRCSLQYYFNRVAGIGEEEEMEEKLGTDEFGNWIHQTLENIDREFSENNRQITKEDIGLIISQIPERLKTEFGTIKPVQLLDQGQNYILYQVAKQVLKDLFEKQLTEDIFPLEILDVEKQLMVEVTLPIHGELLNIKIAGRIDRLDRVNGSTLRVIDYKTGLVKESNLDLAPKKATPTEREQSIQENLLTNTDWDKIRQLWLYKYLVLKRMQEDKGLNIGGKRLKADENDIVTGIYSFRNLQEGFLSRDLAFEEGETDGLFLQHSEEKLQQFLEELLNPGKPFHKTPDLKTCQYCSYRRICGR